MTPELKYEIVELIDERIRERHVTKEDFSELKSIVRDIAIEQRKLATEQKELARAQKETQEELKALAIELKETQEQVKALAIEQKETQEQVKALAIEQKELARAQKETQEQVKALAQAMNKMQKDLFYTRQDVGGITSTLGYMLENEAYRILPRLLEDRYKIEVKERFLRRSLKSLRLKQEGEINIFSHGVYKDRKTEVVIIGEAKSQLNIEDIDSLFDKAKKLQKIDKRERFLLAITHYTRDSVIKHAHKKGIEVIQSFEW